MENQNDLYITKEHFPREIFGHELPHWVFPRQQYLVIRKSQDSIKENRFDSIGGLVKYCINQRGDEYSLDELHLDELSDEEKGYFRIEKLKNYGLDIWLP